jgi:hypothetical protein
VTLLILRGQWWRVLGWQPPPARRSVATALETPRGRIEGRSRRGLPRTTTIGEFGHPRWGKGPGECQPSNEKKVTMSPKNRIRRSHGNGTRNNISRLGNQLRRRFECRTIACDKNMDTTHLDPHYIPRKPHSERRTCWFASTWRIYILSVLC